MKASSIAATLAGFLPMTLAAPAYVPYAYNVSAPAVHNKPITATNGWFYVGNVTTATCPTYEPDCPSKNTTIISGPTYGQEWWMGILEAGGQLIFYGAGGGGRIGYAEADSSNYLPYYTSYSYTLTTKNTTYGLVLQPENTNWITCADGVHIHGANSDASCTDTFEIVLKETTAPAVQYYDCEGCSSRCSSRYGC